MLRHSAIQALRPGPTRTATQHIVWFDTADGALASSGVMMAQSLGRPATWRMERLRPDSPLEWLPGTAPPVLAEADSADDLPYPVPGPLAAVAAFRGRLKTVALGFAEGPGQLGMLDGELRGVAEEKPACRLRLSGPAEACTLLACTLAGPLGIRVPRASLAAEGIALARATPPPPARLGAPALPPGLSAGDAAAWVVAHLAEVILHWARQVPTSSTPEPVHQMRVGVRRLRSALSVFRRMAEDEDGGCTWLDALSLSLRDLAALLGTARDWDVFVTETAAQAASAMPGERRLAQMLAAADRKREAAYGAVRTYLAGAAWAELAMSMALLAARRPWRAAPAAAASAEATLAHALARRLKHVLSPGEDLSGLPAKQLHEIRKQAKRLRYATEFAAPLFGGRSVRRYLERLEDLQEALGAVNDLDVATGLTRQLEGAFAAGVIQGFGAARAARAAARVRRVWRKFYRADPFW